MNPGRTTVSRSTGFTLVEVLVSMAVLSIGLLVTLPLVTSALTRSVHGRKMTAAQYVGNSVLERLRFEVRFDPGPPSTSGCGGTTGCTRGQEFTLANAWESERLPHSINDDLVDQEACNPPGAGDAIDFNVGPFPIRLEDNTYQVCYALSASSAPTVILGTLEATVRVIWPSPIGFGARTMTSVLIPRPAGGEDST